MDGAIIIIGDEILSGVVAEVNVVYLARRCARLGIKVRRVFTVADEPKDIIWALGQARYIARLVFVSGGLGPTPDDCTRHVISKHFSMPLVQDEETMNSIIDHFIRCGTSMPAWSENQALIPQGAQKLANPLGTAPGLLVKRRGSHYFFLPGVPDELKATFEKSVIEILTNVLPEQEEHRAMIRTTGIAEGRLCEAVDQHIKNKDVSVSFLPSLAGVDLFIRGKQKAAFDDVVEAVRKAVGNHIYAETEQELKQVVGVMLKERKLTVAVAESCTGGLLGSFFTGVPGSSEYFVGGIIAYSNDMKVKQAGVTRETLEKFGAVSRETAEAMASGVQTRLSSNIGIGITGIAGPGGGAPAKPVGLVYIGLAAGKATYSEKHVFSGDRERIREQAVVAALDLLRRYLSGKVK